MFTLTHPLVCPPCRRIAGILSYRILIFNTAKYLFCQAKNFIEDLIQVMNMITKIRIVKPQPWISRNVSAVETSFSKSESVLCPVRALKACGLSN